MVIISHFKQCLNLRNKIGKTEKTNWEFSPEHRWFGVYWYLSSRYQKQEFF